MESLGVGRVLEQCDAPADQRRDDPRLAVQGFQVAVPGEGHEDVGQRQHDDGREIGQRGHSISVLASKRFRQHKAGHAGLAQLVEQRFCKPKVAGSIPATGTTLSRSDRE